MPNPQPIEPDELDLDAILKACEAHIYPSKNGCCKCFAHYTDPECIELLDDMPRLIAEVRTLRAENGLLEQRAEDSLIADVLSHPEVADELGRLRETLGRK